MFEISMLVFLKKDVEFRKSTYEIGRFLDSGMSKNTELLELHNKNTYKNYCFCSFFPLEKDRIYKSKNNYSIKIRTVNPDLARFFNTELVNYDNDCMKGLTSEIRILPQKHIEKIYSITPTIIKTDKGYWKNNITLSEFENRLKSNMVKKYNLFTGTKLEEDFQLYTSMEFLNRKPVVLEYKGKKILGDKLLLCIGDDKRAQDLAYMSLGTGLMEMNARGAGYMNFRYL